MVKILIQNTDETYLDITANVERSADFKDQIDESLPTLTFTISPLSNKETFEMGRKVVLKDDGTTIDCFVIVSDQVEQIGRNPSAYAHHIQCTQRVRETSFHLMRGIDLSQPYRDGKRDAVGSQFFFYYQTTSPVLYLWAKNDGYYRTLTRVVSTQPFTKEKVSGGTITQQSYFFGNSKISNATATLNVNVVKGDGTTLFSVSSFPYTLDTDEVALINSALDSGYSVGFEYPNTPSTTGVSTETGYAFTTRLSVESYFYTYYDVLNEILLNAQDCESNDIISYVLAKLPTSGDFYDFLTSTIAPDFQFQLGTTLYSAIQEVFRSFGAKAIIDENGYIGAQYFNYKAPKNDNFLNENAFVAQVKTKKDANVVSRLFSPYQNGVPDKSVVVPLNGYTTPRNKQLGVPSRNDWWFLTGTKINKIKSFKTNVDTGTGFTSPTITISFYKSGASSKSEYSYTFLGELDLSDQVYDNETYSNLDTASGNTSYATQRNCFMYTQNQDGIYVGNINKTVWNGEEFNYANALYLSAYRTFGGISGFSGTSDKPYMWRFKCEYYPVAEGVALIESPDKKPYGGVDDAFTKRYLNEMTLAQSNGVVSLPKLGTSLYGTLSSIGNDERTATYRTTVFSSTHFFKGQWLQDGDDLWIVQTAKETILDDGTIKTDLMLTKNYAQLPNRIKLDRAVRMTNISTNLVLRKEIFIHRCLELSSCDNISDVETYDTTWTNDNIVASLFGSPFLDYGYAQVGSMKLVGFNNTVFMPIVKYSLGNTVSIEGNFENAMSAGNYTKVVNGFFSDNVSSQSAIYTNAYGFLDKAKVQLCSTDYTEEISQYPLATNGYDLQEFNIEPRKKPNDILGVNVSFSYVSDDLIIYPALAKHCNLIGGTSSTKIYLFTLTEDDAPYSISDTIGRGAKYSNENSLQLVVHDDDISTSKHSHYFALWDDIAHPVNPRKVLPSNATGWMITDEFGSPLIAKNGASTTNEVIVYCKPLKNRGW